MNKVINKAADNIRILAASMVEKAKSGHPGGAMGGADFINVLYAEFLNFDPDDRTWANRDRFFLDPGHMSPMLYSVLCLTGSYSLEDLQNFRQWGSITPGHPEVDKVNNKNSSPQKIVIQYFIYYKTSKIILSYNNNDFSRSLKAV